MIDRDAVKKAVKHYKNVKDMPPHWETLFNLAQEYLNKPFEPVGESELICPNCGGLKSVRNPSGYCDHLYYPDNISGEICQHSRPTGTCPHCAGIGADKFAEPKFQDVNLLNKLNEQDEEIKRYKDALRQIEDLHFECDGGEACHAHNIAKATLLIKV